MVHTAEEGFYDAEIRNLRGRIYIAPTFNVMNYVSYLKFWNNFFNSNTEHHIVHGHIGSFAALYLSIAKKHGYSNC